MVKLNRLLGYVFFASTLAINPGYGFGSESQNSSYSAPNPDNYLSCPEISEEIKDGLKDIRKNYTGELEKRLNSLMDLEVKQGCFEKMKSSDE